MASCVPPDPLASDDRSWNPSATRSASRSAAPRQCRQSTRRWHCWSARSARPTVPPESNSGFTEMEAVGAGGGGGGGGGGGTFFFPQAPSARRAPSAYDQQKPLHALLLHFYFLPATLEASPGSDEAYLLFPTPIRLRVASRKSQLLHLGPVGQHRPDLQACPNGSIETQCAGSSGDHDGKSFRPPSCVSCTHCLLAISIK